MAHIQGSGGGWLECKASIEKREPYRTFIAYQLSRLEKKKEEMKDVRKRNFQLEASTDLRELVNEPVKVPRSDPNALLSLALLRSNKTKMAATYENSIVAPEISCM